MEEISDSDESDIDEYYMGTPDDNDNDDDENNWIKGCYWKPVPIDGFEDKYLVSNLGMIKSVRTKRIMKPEINMCYHRIALAKPGMKQNSKHFSVHRLVAMAFIPNKDPKKNTLVNHKDGNKTNNTSSNLEWCSVTENNAHALRTGLRVPKGRSIIITDINGDEFEYESQKAAQLAIPMGENTILRALKGTKPFGWTIRYKDESNHKVPVDLTNFVPIKEFPSYYINKEGKVFSKAHERFLKQRKDLNGYPMYGFYKDKRSINRKVHVLLAIAFIPNPENKPVVNHIDHNKLNYSLYNLEYCTHKENTQAYYEMKRNRLLLSQTEQSADGDGENSSV